MTHRPRLFALPLVVASCSASGVAFADDVASVEVSAPLISRATRDAFAASTVVRGPELEAAGQSSADVLARIPGVGVQRQGAQSDIATASIRGSDASQVPVYVAGIRINDDASGVADLSTVPLWMMDRVEVYRGNTPSGSDQLGMAGAIYFHPRRPKTTRIGAGAQVGSFGARGGFVAGEVGNDTAGALVAVRREQADNDYTYLQDDGVRFVPNERRVRRPNADFVAHDAWAIGRYRLSRADSFTTVMNAYDREQGVTGLAVVPAETTRARTRRLLTGVSGTFGCPGARDTCRVETQASLLTAHVTYTDPLNDLPSLRSPYTTNAGNRANVRASITADVSDAFRLGGGLSQTVESLRVDRVADLPNDGDRSSTHAFANATVTPVTPLHLYGLAALDCHTTSGVENRFGFLVARDSGACGVLQPAARLGVSYDVAPSVELLANVGRYVRIPTFSELYGSSALVQGDSGLRPETGVSADLGVRASIQGPAGRYAVDAFVFARYAGDLIRYRTVSFGVLAPYNVGGARFLGAEGSVSGDWLGALRARVSATVIDPRDLTASTTNDVLPYTPKLVASARLEAYATPGLAILRQSQAAIAVVYLHRASRYDSPSGLVVLPEQHFLDVEATSTHFDGKVVARFAVRNVIGSYQYDLIGLPLPGRSAHASLEAWW